MIARNNTTINDHPPGWFFNAMIAAPLSARTAAERAGFSCGSREEADMNISKTTIGKTEQDNAFTRD